MKRNKNKRKHVFKQGYQKNNKKSNDYLTKGSIILNVILTLIIIFLNKSSNDINEHSSKKSIELQELQIEREYNKKRPIYKFNLKRDVITYKGKEKSIIIPKIENLGEPVLQEEVSYERYIEYYKSEYDEKTNVFTHKVYYIPYIFTGLDSGGTYDKNGNLIRYLYLHSLDEIFKSKEDLKKDKYYTNWGQIKLLARVKYQDFLGEDKVEYYDTSNNRRLTNKEMIARVNAVVNFDLYCALNRNTLFYNEKDSITFYQKFFASEALELTCIEKAISNNFNRQNEFYNEVPGIWFNV
ncbi:hypothetical protein MKC91_11925 [[Clostridium] innocuum]|nr:hypothetical protein [[Clostridium] innocuum]MCR0534214.1 hypothetical protein [[Clostridium] innocuum]MCR0539107.1 hypothetical protein [[Clostridium] innocuum]MDU1118887.1 hypothetical protein [Erysipelotrichaceae bacterium]